VTGEDVPVLRSGGGSVPAVHDLRVRPFAPVPDVVDGELVEFVMLAERTA
jgi:hypothetical protein